MFAENGKKNGTTTVFIILRGKKNLRKSIGVRAHCKPLRQLASFFERFCLQYKYMFFVSVQVAGSNLNWVCFTLKKS